MILAIFDDKLGISSILTVKYAFVPFKFPIKVGIEKDHAVIASPVSELFLIGTHTYTETKIIHFKNEIIIMVAIMAMT